MTDRNTLDRPQGQKMTDVLRNWMMVALTVVFVLLYAAALIGWLKPLADASMITRLEPIIFVIIGYYFGRLPAQQNEKTLKDEISRQTQKADAVQYTKEQAQQEREVLEEKLKNVKASLSVGSHGVSSSRLESREFNMGLKDVSANQSIETALKILDS
jgi:hypothetical protein